MYILFDEAGKFHAGKILSQTATHAQIELDTGKRIKVKAANQILSFSGISPKELIQKAQELASETDISLAWEFAPEGEFTFEALAEEYYGEKTDYTQKASILFALFNAPHYFRRAGKGKFKKAPQEIVEQALKAIEKKKAIEAQIQNWTNQLIAEQTPEEIKIGLYKILFNPDKNAPEYKAVARASQESKQGALELLQKAGAIASPYEFHWQRFLYKNFPKGTKFQELPETDDGELQNLETANKKAFSIDDSLTTEIDDALSLEGLGTGQVELGIHIAAPALGIKPEDAIDKVARERQSTVYTPGNKITMLPKEIIDKFTLNEGSSPAAVSIYIKINEQTLEITETETKIQRVPIAANLRSDKLEEIITEESLTTQAGQEQLKKDLKEHEEKIPELTKQLSFLYKLAKSLKAKREIVRGKPETFTRPDYNFKVLNQDGSIKTNDIKGDEKIQITERKRGEPLDLIVAEAMILANSTWGNWLAEIGVVGIYRTQASMAPGVKVRMKTRALPHAGIGVSSYTWSTSPLRRYIDLVNQWQIIAAAKNKTTAPLIAPFKPKDVNLYGIISAFESIHDSYRSYQNSIEKYWTLKYIEQENITEVEAKLIKEQSSGVWLARAQTLPLIITAIGTSISEEQARGAIAHIKLGKADKINLEINGTITNIISQTQAEESEEDIEEIEKSQEEITIQVDIENEENSEEKQEESPQNIENQQTKEDQQENQ